MRSCLLFSLLLHSLSGREAGGCEWHCGWDWASPVLARSPPLLLVRDSQSCSRSSGGLRRERSRSHLPRAYRGSSRAARGERYRDRSRSVGSRVTSRVLAPLAVRGLVDKTALAAPLPALLPCVRGLVNADLGLRTASCATKFVRGHDVSVLGPLAIVSPLLPSGP